MQHPDGSVDVPLTGQREAELRAAILSAKPFDVNEAIEALFTYHAPEGDQPGQYLRIREAAKTLAYVVDQCCPPSADRTTAIRKISEAVMSANASIARRGVEYR